MEALLKAERNLFHRSLFEFVLTISHRVARNADKDSKASRALAASLSNDDTIALGTGDIDCVYHIALYELIEAARKLDNEAVHSVLDISDLPLDLAV